MVPTDKLLDFDAWAVARAAALQEEVVAAYRDYQFHVIYQRVHNFCVNDLGGLYLDVLKDRMYTTPAEGHARRSGQTAMFHILQAMVRWLAPILSFTAEEIWQVLPGRDNAAKSVLLTTWYEFPSLPKPGADWNALISLRQAVQRELEKLREAGTIGAPLEAQLDVYCLPAEAQRLKRAGQGAASSSPSLRWPRCTKWRLRRRMRWPRKPATRSCLASGSRSVAPAARNVCAAGTGPMMWASMPVTRSCAGAAPAM